MLGSQLCVKYLTEINAEPIMTKKMAEVRVEHVTRHVPEIQRLKLARVHS